MKMGSGFRFVLITATIAATVALLIIAGCTQKPQPSSQPAQTSQPQPKAPQDLLPLETPNDEYLTPEEALRIRPLPQPPQDDTYKDNLDGALDDLSQLE